MINMIYLSTKAYNAEKTIASTIESVLAQNFGDFIYYVCNNGSLDDTERIIQEYSLIDKRVVLIRQQSNIAFYKNRKECNSEMENYYYKLRFNIGTNDWYSSLDADDNLEPDFFKELLYFAQQENLDYVACRSNFIKEPDNIICNEYILDDDIVMKSKKDFGNLFPTYFRFIGANWGKLQKGNLFKKFKREYYYKWLDEKELFCRLDTASQLFYLSYSERAGVRAKALHNYHIYPKGKSLNTQKLQAKLQDNLKMPDIYRDFLTKKVGYVSETNEKFIQEVFERSQRRTYEEMGYKNDSI